MQNERTFQLTEEDVLRAVTVSASFIAFPLNLCCHVSFVYSVGDSKLALQIHPVVSRLCASIQGTSPARLAECLGIDSAKVRMFC